MPGTHAARAAALSALTLILAAGIAPGEQMPTAQLPLEWAGLFPPPAEILGTTHFPIVKAPQDGGQLPFVLPGTAHVTPSDRAFYDSQGAGTPITAVSISHEVDEKTTWTADGREIVLWEAFFDVGIRRYASQDEVTTELGNAFDPAGDEPVSVGDQAFFDGIAGRDEEILYARTGPYWVTVKFSVAPGMYRGAVHEPLKQLTADWARMIVQRILGAPIAGGTGAQTGGQTGGQTGTTGQRIAVTAQSAGGPVQTQYVDVPAGRNPGEITIRVTTTSTVQGQPQPLGGVTVALPDHGVQATTSPQGTAVLRAQAGGADPIIGTVSFDLAAQPAALEVVVQGANLLPVMGSGDVQVSVRDAQTHAPVSDATVRITVVDQAKLPFVALQQPAEGPTPAAGAPFVRTITVNQPEQAMVDDGRLKLHDLPLTVRLKVEAWLTANPAVRGEAQWAPTMDLMLLHGTTVGPDFAPRSEANAPRLLGGGATRPHLASALHPANAGEFFVLTRASFYSDQLTLAWPPGCRLSLQVPMARFADRLAGRSAQAGQTLELGKIDVLDPAEHEQRLKDWVAEFLGAMGFDNGHLASTQALVRALPVQYPGGSPGTPPRYGAGRIEVFDAPQDYWGTQAFAGDGPYAIFMHELGHAVHKGMVDRWLDTLSVWDKCFSGGGHSTWLPPDASTAKGRAMTSFFEAVADFHAYCVYAWLDRAHPEFKRDSLYYERSYLAQFDSDARALAARSQGGWQVEGVQTTFLREVFAPEFAAGPGGPATAFGTVLRMADAWKSESWLLRWVPARTITEWVAMKRKHAPGAGLDEAVQKYGLVEGATGRVLLPSGSNPRPVQAKVNHVAVTLAGDTVAVDVADGDTVEMVDGQGLVLVEAMGQPANYRRVFLDQGTQCRFEAGDRLTVAAGRVIVDGTMVITAGTTVITPTGTTVMVELADTGTAVVTVVEGGAQVAAAGGTVALTAAQALTISPDGRPGTPTTANLAQVMDGMLGADAGGQIATGGGTGTGGTPGGGTTGGGTTGGGAGWAPEAMALPEDSAIRQAVICLGFDERSRLRGVQDVFPADTEKVALFLDIEGARPNSEIQITFVHEGRILGRQVLLLSGDKKNLSYLYAGGRDTLWPGAYAAEVEENGRLVARLLFRVAE